MCNIVSSPWLQRELGESTNFLKFLKVVPHPESLAKTNPTNYRQMSILFGLSKFLEKHAHI